MMAYRFDATEDYFHSVSEIDRLISLAESDNNLDRNLFLKLSIVSLVTKLQVFIEAILDEYRFKVINGQRHANEFPIYFRMNSLQQAILENNVFEKLTKHKNFTPEKLPPILRFIQNMNYIIDDEAILNESIHLCTKFPLGKTGKNEIIDLLKQIDGEANPFGNDETLDTAILDSLLQTRHRVVHQDAFSGTSQNVSHYKGFCSDLVTYIDAYLCERLYLR